MPAAHHPHRTDRPLATPERVGAVLWVAVAQYFVVLLVVQAAWTTPYSIVMNAISDLGAVGCGDFEGRDVCSPWHAAANVSWALTGLSMAAGAVLLRRVLARGLAGRIGLALLVVSGVGELLVGLNPEDASTWHVPAALVAIVAGLTALLALGSSLARQETWRTLGRLGIAFGALGFTSAVIALTIAPARLFGLFERIAAYPILVWVVVAGAVLLRHARRATAAHPTPTGGPTRG